jgi:hypothetical protein
MSPSPSPSASPRSWHRGLAATLLVVPLLAALLLRPGAGTGQLAGLALLAEPLFIGVAGYLLLLLLTRRWWLSAFTVTIGTAAAVALLHAPVSPAAASPLEIPWSGQALECMDQAGLPNAPLRLLSWNTSDAPLDDRALEVLVDQRPDLVVLTGLHDGSFLERLAEILPGESLAFGTEGDQLGLYVRGIFLDCGDEGGAWPLSIFGQGQGPILADYALDHADQEQLPQHHAARRTSGQLVFALTRVQGVGTVPVVAYQLPVESSGLGSATWTGAVYDGSQALAATSALGGVGVVAIGHLAVPPTFQHIQATLSAAGLQDAGGPPTWPARLGPLPFLPLYRMERVLSGPIWRAHSAEVVALPGQHKPLLVQLVREQGDEPTPFGGDG